LESRISPELVDVVFWIAPYALVNQFNLHHIDHVT